MFKTFNILQRYGSRILTTLNSKESYLIVLSHQNYTENLAKADILQHFHYSAPEISLFNRKTLGSTRTACCVKVNQKELISDQNLPYHPVASLEMFILMQPF